MRQRAASALANAVDSAPFRTLRERYQAAFAQLESRYGYGQKDAVAWSELQAQPGFRAVDQVRDAVASWQPQSGAAMRRLVAACEAIAEHARALTEAVGRLEASAASAEDRSFYSRLKAALLERMGTVTPCSPARKRARAASA